MNTQEDILNQRCSELLSWAIRYLMEVRQDGSPWHPETFNEELVHTFNRLIDESTSFLTWTDPESTYEERKP